MYIKYQKAHYYASYDDYVLISWISELIRRFLTSISDKEVNIMSNVAILDFKNWIKFKKGLLGERSSDEKADAMVSWMLDNQPDELKSFLEMWIEGWLLKWKQRVKVVFEENKDMKQAKELFTRTSNVWLKLPYKDELKEMIIGSLISIGELCFTEIISESILRGELSKYIKHVGSEDRLVELLNKNSMLILRDALSNVRKIARTKGPLIVIRVDPKVLRPSVEEGSKRGGKRRWSWRSFFE